MLLEIGLRFKHYEKLKNPSVIECLKASAELLERAEFETDNLGAAISFSNLKDQINQLINDIEPGDEK